MKRSSRLSVLLKIEEERERQEARKFVKQKKLLNEKMGKLAELEGYFGEYRDRFSELTRFGSPAVQVRSSYAFICQLKSIIDQQQEAISDSERSVEELRQRWLEAKRRVDALQMAIDKMIHEERERDNRNEQSLADEVARRKHHRL